MLSPEIGTLGVAKTLPTFLVLKVVTQQFLATDVYVISISIYFRRIVS